MAKRGHGTIIFTGATAALRGSAGFAKGVRCVRICDRDALEKANDGISSESITGALSTEDRRVVAQRAECECHAILSI